MIAIVALALAADPAVAYRQGLDAAADARAARPHFAEAARLYEEDWRSGGRSAALAGNRAQAYLLADDLPNAMRAYREGLRLDPSDGRLRRGLEFARDQVTYPAPRLRPSEPFRLTHRLSGARWLLVAFSVYAVGWWALARRRGASAVVAVAAGLALAAWVMVEGGLEDRRPFVVVARDGVMLRQGNADSYPARFDAPLARGVEAAALHRRGGWWQVELADGTVGWLPESATVSSED